MLNQCGTALCFLYAEESYPKYERQQRQKHPEEPKNIIGVVQNVPESCLQVTSVVASALAYALHYTTVRPDAFDEPNKQLHDKYTLVCDLALFSKSGV